MALGNGLTLNRRQAIIWTNYDPIHWWIYAALGGDELILARRMMSSHGNAFLLLSLIAKFMGPTWGPPGSCRPQMGPMLAPWTLLSGIPLWGISTNNVEIWSFLYDSLKNLLNKQLSTSDSCDVNVMVLCWCCRLPHVDMCQNQAQRAWIINYIPLFSVGCN